MKNSLIFLILVITFCSKETECVEIKDKGSGGGKYFFYWNEKLTNVQNQIVIMSRVHQYMKSIIYEKLLVVM